MKKIALSLMLSCCLPILADNNSRQILYVNASSGSDENWCGGPELPFRSIQYAVDHSVSNGVIVVAEGGYLEAVCITNHAVTIVGCGKVQQTRLSSMGWAPCLFIGTQAGGTVIEGLTLNNGEGYYKESSGGRCGGNVYCLANATFSNCLVVDGTANYGGGFYFDGAEGTAVTIRHCTVVDHDYRSGLICLTPNVQLEVSESILWNNSYSVFLGDGWGGSVSIDHSCLDRGERSFSQVDVKTYDEMTSDDPCFVGSDDYRLDERSPCRTFGRPDGDGNRGPIGFLDGRGEAFSGEESDYAYYTTAEGAVLIGVSSNVTGHVVLPTFLGGLPVVAMEYPKDTFGEFLPGGPLFANPDAVETVEFPRYCVRYEDGLFADYPMLRSVVLSEFVREVGFPGCAMLDSIELPSSVTNITSFEGCHKLRTISIPASLQTIYNNSFRDCDIVYFRVDAANPYFSDDVAGCLYDKEKKILYRLSGGGYDSSLNYYLWGNGWNLPLSLEVVGSSAAYGCRPMYGAIFAIPASVTNIASDAFANASSLICSHVHVANEVYSSGENGAAIYSKDGATLFNYHGSGHFTVPSGVTNIESMAFGMNQKLTSVTIPDSVVTMGQYPFARCNALREIVMPRNVETIHMAFANCEGLERVVFPEGCKTKYLYDGVFQFCTNLTSVTLSEGIEFMGNSVFWNCTKLSDLTVPESVKVFGLGSELTALTNLQFRGVPPSETRYAESSTIDAPLATGYYRPKYAAEWQAVIDTNGRWRGIPMVCRPMTNVVRYVVGEHASRVGGGALVQSVLDGSAAEAPQLTAESGWAFMGWDADFSYVNTDLNVKAVLKQLVNAPVVVSTSEAFDTASQEVTISCATEGATVYYTIDGSEPSATNGRVYKGPFNIYDSVMVKAIAVKDDWKDSAVMSAAFTKKNGLSAAINMYDYLPDNDLSAPWTVDTEVSHDGMKSVRSGAIGEDGVTTMKVTVRGEGKLTFWWKSECEEWDEDYYDCGAFRVGNETEPRFRIAGMTDWKREEVVFDTTGEHVCKWEYHKDDAESIPRDCLWVDQVQWMPSDGGGKTLTTEVAVPYAWLDQYGLGDDTDFETAASRPSAKKGVGYVWQEYLLGLDPTDADDKVEIAAPQSDDPDGIALGLADGHTDGSGYVAEVRVEKDGKVVSEDGVIDLSGEDDPTGLYTVAVSLVREGDAAKVAEVPAAQTVGVQKGKSTMAKTAISVPWGRLNGGGPVSVADLVKTANLTVGDKLHVYNKAAKRYETWELDADRVWQPLATYLIKPDGSVSTVSAGKPTDTMVKRGSAVWLERQDPTKPYYLYGGYEAGEIETEVEAGSAAEPSWNLIAAPSVEPFDLNRIEGADAKDQIVVTTETGPVVYTFKDGAWGCDVNKTEKRKGPGGVEIEVVKRVRDTEHATIPAGVGFWYVSQGGKPVIKW